MKNKKGNAIIIMIIIVVVAVTAGTVGWMFAKKSEAPVMQQKSSPDQLAQSSADQRPIISNEIESWKTYTSKEYGYSVQFPSDLYFKGNKVQSFPGEFGAQDLIISDIEDMGVQDVLLNEKIHIVITTSKKSPSESLLASLKKIGIKESDLTGKITFNGVESYKIEQIYPEFSSKSIYISNNDIVYNLYSINYQKESFGSENFRLMQQIVDTFKFANTCATAGGKAGFVMHDKKCYAPGENIPDTDCTVSSTGGCKSLE